MLQFEGDDVLSLVTVYVEQYDSISNNYRLLSDRFIICLRDSRNHLLEILLPTLVTRRACHTSLSLTHLMCRGTYITRSSIPRILNILPLTIDHLEIYYLRYISIPLAFSGCMTICHWLQLGRKINFKLFETFAGERMELCVKI